MSIRKGTKGKPTRTKTRKKGRQKKRKKRKSPSLLGDYRHGGMLPLVETEGGVEITDLSNICLDDRCNRVELHAVHKINPRAMDPFNDAKYTVGMQRHGETLRSIVVKHVSRRRCKPFREIYNDVLDDYGTFSSDGAGTRAIWRAISDLLKRHEIVPVKPPGTRFRGGYVRSDSPLLKDNDGRRFLLEQLEDQYSAE